MVAVIITKTDLSDKNLNNISSFNIAESAAALVKQTITNSSNSSIGDAVLTGSNTSDGLNLSDGDISMKSETDGQETATTPSNDNSFTYTDPSNVIHYVGTELVTGADMKMANPDVGTTLTLLPVSNPSNSSTTTISITVSVFNNSNANNVTTAVEQYDIASLAAALINIVYIPAISSNDIISIVIKSITGHIVVAGMINNVAKSEDAPKQSIYHDSTDDKYIGTKPIAPIYLWTNPGTNTGITIPASVETSDYGIIESVTDVSLGYNEYALSNEIIDPYLNILSTLSFSAVPSGGIYTNIVREQSLNTFENETIKETIYQFPEFSANMYNGIAADPVARYNVVDNENYSLPISYRSIVGNNTPMNSVTGQFMSITSLENISNPLTGGSKVLGIKANGVAPMRLQYDLSAMADPTRWGLTNTSTIGPSVDPYYNNSVGNEPNQGNYMFLFFTKLNDSSTNNTVRMQFTYRSTGLSHQEVDPETFVPSTVFDAPSTYTYNGVDGYISNPHDVHTYNSMGHHMIKIKLKSLTFTTSDNIYLDMEIGSNLVYAGMLLRSSDYNFALSGDFSAPCFLKGTKIATPDGEKDIADIVAGDVILNKDRNPVTVEYNAYRRINPNSKSMKQLTPYIVPRNKFGNNVPSRATYVSPWHRIQPNNGPMKEAMKFGSLKQYTMRTPFIYYNLRTSEGDNGTMIANNMISETFIPGPKHTNMLYK